MPTGQTATGIASTKIAWYAAAVAFFESMNVPERMIIMLFFLMFVDFMTGLGKAWKIKDPVTSHKITEGAMKKIFMLLMIASLCGFLFGIGLDPFPAFNFFVPILLAAEFYSIIQNVYAFRTGELLPEYDVISVLLKKIGEFVVQFLKNSITKSGDMVSALIRKK